MIARRAGLVTYTTRMGRCTRACCASNFAGDRRAPRGEHRPAQPVPPGGRGALAHDVCSRSRLTALADAYARRWRAHASALAIVLPFRRPGGRPARRRRRRDVPERRARGGPGCDVDRSVEPVRRHSPYASTTDAQRAEGRRSLARCVRLFADEPAGSRRHGAAVDGGFCTLCRGAIGTPDRLTDTYAKTVKVVPRSPTRCWTSTRRPRRSSPPPWGHLRVDNASPHQIWRSDGVIVYSDEQRLVERKFSSKDLKGARGGQRYHRIGDTHNAENVFER